MKCSRMKLGERSDTRQIRGGAARTQCSLQQHHRLPPQLSTLHHLKALSWLQRPCIGGTDTRRHISVSELVLPTHLQHVSSPGVLRWTNRHPRLRSKNSLLTLPATTPRKLSQDGQLAAHRVPDSERLSIKHVMHEYEIDENVQKLIEEASEYDGREPSGELVADEQEFSSNRKRKKRKRSTKKKKNECPEEGAVVECALPKFTRTVSVCLSRPASPETEQVIRVDVVTNYSIQEPHNSAATRYTHSSRPRNIAGGRTRSVDLSPTLHPAPDLVVRCHRLQLANRTSFIS